MNQRQFPISNIIIREIGTSGNRSEVEKVNAQNDIEIFTALNLGVNSPFIYCDGSVIGEAG